MKSIWSMLILIAPSGGGVVINTISFAVSFDSDHICGIYRTYYSKRTCRLFIICKPRTTHSRILGSVLADYKKQKLCQFKVMVRSIFIIICVVHFHCQVIRRFATHWIMSSLVESNFYEYLYNKDNA